MHRQYYAILQLDRSSFEQVGDIGSSREETSMEISLTFGSNGVEIVLLSITLVRESKSFFTP